MTTIFTSIRSNIICSCTTKTASIVTIYSIIIYLPIFIKWQWSKAIKRFGKIYRIMRISLYYFFLFLFISLFISLFFRLLLLLYLNIFIIFWWFFLYLYIINRIKYRFLIIISIWNKIMSLHIIFIFIYWYILR